MLQTIAGLRRALIVALLILGVQEPGQAEWQELGQALQHLLQKRDWHDVGIAVAACPAGQWRFRHQARKSFIPASTVKLITTAAALLYLGPKFQHQTVLYACGPIQAGTLEGDLVVSGSGDPYISGRFFQGQRRAVLQEWARQLQARQITCIHGDLLIDDGVFQPPATHPSWCPQDLVQWYAAPVTALSFNDNCVDLEITPAKPGTPPTIRVYPTTHYVRVINQLLSGPGTYKVTRKLAKQSRQDCAGCQLITLQGYCEHHTWRWVPVQDPGMYLGVVLGECLRQAGIRLQGRIRRLRSPAGLLQAIPLAKHCAPLPQTVQVINQRSQNLHAELLLFTLAVCLRGQGNFRVGSQILTEFLQSSLPGVSGFQLVDGSGLSRQNRLNARQLVRFLLFMRRQPQYRCWVRSLPVSGISGTLRRRLAARPYRGRIQAKSGSMHHVSSLAGYLHSLSDQHYAFAIMSNQALPRKVLKQLEDAVCRLLVLKG